MSYEYFYEVFKNFTVLTIFCVRVLIGMYLEK